MCRQDKDDLDALNLSADWPRVSKLMMAIRRKHDLKAEEVGGSADCINSGGGSVATTPRALPLYAAAISFLLPDLL